ncbi:hypothetical protein IQ238_10730 [Pleurocapsales cyanobacterium LEGE 06147]|nr:hypothetical protein [Pleurocapsales cyanobacterium LEGE 06147]
MPFSPEPGVAQTKCLAKSLARSDSVFIAQSRNYSRYCLVGVVSHGFQLLAQHSSAD